MLDTLEYKQMLLDVSSFPETLVAALAALPELAPQADATGNIQAVFRLDGTPGAWVATVPTTVDSDTVTEAAAGADAAATAAREAYLAAAATAEDHATASAAIITEKLAEVPVPRGSLDSILRALLGQAAAAIPFFEQYALDPDMNAQQWTDFQALNQTTKDRLLYDAIRSLAALMRYLSGDLPA